MNNYPPIAILGAGAFGAIIGWFIYFLNRYRSGEVQFSDLTTLIGIIGGASILKLFGSGGSNAAQPDGSSALFGAYGIGLFLGFFGYFFTLIWFVKNSKGIFTWTWFLDGRRKKLASDEDIQGTRTTLAPMDVRLPEAISPNQLAGAVTPQEVVVSLQQERPPLGLTVIDPTAARIISICDSNWDANKGDCNGFVLAVAAALSVPGLVAPADAIVDTVTTSADWRVLADGVEAKQAADAGQFVIGGLKGAEHQPPRTHGHVVVVVSGGLAQGKYPTAYWGSIGGTPGKNMTVNYAWNANDRNQVHYAARNLS